MGGFDSSDEENENTPIDTKPLTVNWLALSNHGFSADLGVCSLPGCRFKDTWRSMKTDIATITSLDVSDVFVLCSKGELSKYRAQNLLEQYKEAGIIVHHHPFPDGQTPSVGTMLNILKELRVNLESGKKTLIHCYGGLGRSCLVVACLLLSSDDKLEPDQAIARIKDLRGSGAVQSVKQYNFINDFRENVSKFENSKAEAETDSVSS